MKLSRFADRPTPAASRLVLDPHGRDGADLGDGRTTTVAAYIKGLQHAMAKPTVREHLAAARRQAARRRIQAL